MSKSIPRSLPFTLGAKDGGELAQQILDECEAGFDIGELRLRRKRIRRDHIAREAKVFSGRLDVVKCEVGRTQRNVVAVGYGIRGSGREDGCIARGRRDLASAASPKNLRHEACYACLERLETPKDFSPSVFVRLARYETGTVDFPHDRAFRLRPTCSQS